MLRGRLQLFSHFRNSSLCCARCASLRDRKLWISSHFNLLWMCICMIKYPKNTRVYVAHSSRLPSVPSGTEQREWVHDHLYTSPFHRSSVIQDAKPREWCYPQWAGLSILVNLTKIIPHRQARRPSWLKESIPGTLPGWFNVCQVDRLIITDAHVLFLVFRWIPLHQLLSRL